jgi:alpha-tubulin suppressor-like RCC1 family protein
MANVDVTAPRDGSFAWVFGRVTQDDRNVSVSFPKLVDSIPLNAVNSVCSGFRRSVVCGSDGEVYHWGQVFPTSGDADRDRGNFISSRKFQRVQLPGTFIFNAVLNLVCFLIGVKHDADIVPIKLVDSNRHALYAVGNNGCLYSWTGVCEVDQKQMGVGDLGTIFLERAAQAAAVKSLNAANSSSEPSQSAAEPASVASMVLNQNETPFKFATFKPEIVPSFGGHRVVRIACGSNYILASTSAFFISI